MKLKITIIDGMEESSLWEEELTKEEVKWTLNRDIENVYGNGSFAPPTGHMELGKSFSLFANAHNSSETLINVSASKRHHFPSPIEKCSESPSVRSIYPSSSYWEQHNKEVQASLDRLRKKIGFLQQSLKNDFDQDAKIADLQVNRSELALALMKIQNLTIENPDSPTTLEKIREIIEQALLENSNLGPI